MQDKYHSPGLLQREKETPLLSQVWSKPYLRSLSRQGLCDEIHGEPVVSLRLVYPFLPALQCAQFLSAPPPPKGFSQVLNSHPFLLKKLSFPKVIRQRWGSSSFLGQEHQRSDDDRWFGVRRHSEERPFVMALTSAMRVVRISRSMQSRMLTVVSDRQSFNLIRHPWDELGGLKCQVHFCACRYFSTLCGSKQDPSI